MKKFIKVMTVLIGTIMFVACDPNVGEDVIVISTKTPNDNSDETTATKKTDEVSKNENNSENETSNSNSTSDDINVSENDDSSNMDSPILNDDSKESDSESTTSSENEETSVPTTEEIISENSSNESTNPNNEVDDYPCSESNEDKDDYEIVDDSNNNPSTEPKIENESIENNGVLSYNFEEDVKIDDFEYIIIYNNNVVDWYYRGITDDKKGCSIAVNNKFNINVNITSNTISVTRGTSCFRDVSINDVRITDNTVTIKISQ